MRVKLSETKTVQYFVEHVAVPATKGKDKAYTGRTVAAVYDENGALLGHGVAFCNPSDMFRKRVGTSKALGRALKATDLTRAERAAVWARVWNRPTAAK